MRKITIFLVLVLGSWCARSQSFQGFLADNYSGVNSVIVNPANATDSRFKTDINFIGVSGFGGNDYYGVNILDALKGDYDFDLDSKKHPSESNNGELNVDVMGPSFMFNLTEKSSLAIFTRARSFVNVNDINGNTIDEIDNDETDDFMVNEGDFNAFGQAWGELGITYARVLFNEEEHFVKGGLTLKYLQGGGSAYATGKNVSVLYDADGAGPDSGSITTTGQLTYGRYAELDNDNYDYEIPKASGFGADLGFVYEWRPHYNDYVSTNAQGETYVRKDKNKYQLKLGLSITDIGAIKYKEGQEDVYDINAANVSEDDFDNADDVSSFLNDHYNNISSKTGYKTYLPTALHFNADWSFSSKFYVNLNTDLSLVSKDKLNTSHVSNIVSLAPRFESKWFSFYLPLSVVQNIGFQMGTGLRAGPLYIGSGSVISALISDDTKGADVYAGIKIPVYQGKTKDKDGDGVIDKLDGCPKEAGPAENNGCPWGDADADGVLDNEDNCPDVAGPVENNGCPWGDADADGVLDNEDDCPDVAGPVEQQGCPDTDGDGILDKDDKCVDEPGVPENNGCPLDTDGDGVYDKDDNCPENFGTVANNGCPEVTEAVQKALNNYAKTILFETGKTTIKSASESVLNDIIAILNEYPNAKFSIEGHTDSVGSEANNMKLSEGRASSVMNYLIEKGIASGRLSVKGFGESMPKDSNATKEGRANNRRVEINLVK
ncbi:DUF5723 family protein [Aestuariibaculum lutulentum]|uniref:DUF5723 family protein n=1 Tax=Aestuariibaculum lutulentum TaxID=2920935 RepID=A0ABS9RE91_9FLAO|nr:DUF5723 family protein [Aestuariibaculum lutulentum]MCH4551260.1 DUF5723 family protein [Aestuariibaculum lutulentum]